MGSWNGQGDSSDVVTILDGLVSEYGRNSVKYVRGCPFEGNDRSGFSAAKAAVRSSDVAVLSCGKPVVVLISSGRPVELSRIAEQADALMAIWQPGTEGGNAVADVLSGKVNPSGKLAITFPYSSEQQPSFYNQRRSARPKMGHYQDIPKTPAYEFGYGLSYTDFEYGEIRVNAEGENFVAEVDVTNIGPADGSETVLWFISDHYASISRPVKELKHFEKQFIPAGESRTFRFEIEPGKHLSYPDSNGDMVLEKGTFSVVAGGHSADFELK